MLSKLLIKGENAWEFEEIGTVRSDDYDGFYASTKELIPACNTVIKGVWEKEALKTITKLGLKPDLAKKKSNECYRESCLEIENNKIIYISFNTA